MKTLEYKGKEYPYSDNFWARKDWNCRGKKSLW